MKITADRNLCIQAGNCVMSAEAVFDQDDDGVVVLLVDEIPDEELDHVREAVKLCPAQTLRLSEA